jgi:predicted metal-dependent peptidase
LSNQTAEDRLRKARTFLVMHKPFFATLALGLRYVEAESLQYVAAVDGKNMFYQPDKFAGLRQDEANAVLAHEVLHVALAHHLRRGERHGLAWNIACDYVINLMLKREGFALPDGCLLDKSYEGMSSEQVYERLMKSAVRTAGGGITGLPKEDPLGAVLDATDEDGMPLSEADLREAEADLRVRVQQAKAVEDANGAGEGSATADRVVEALKRQREWHRELADLLVSSALKTDQTWLRPSRRFLPAFYLPTMHGQSLGDIGVGFDTSGSVTKKTLQEFAGVCEEILEAFPETVMHVFYCDAEVKSTEELTAHDVPIVLGHAKGGGGTLFFPVFNSIEKLGLNPTAVIYLTDLWGAPDAFPEQPEYPVVWITNDKTRTAPFGRVIRALVD